VTVWVCVTTLVSAGAVDVTVSVSGGTVVGVPVSVAGGAVSTDGATVSITVDPPPPLCSRCVDDGGGAGVVVGVADVVAVTGLG
jgi:hypothetical protein